MTRAKIVKPTKNRQIFLNWVEEYWPRQREDVMLGRVEVNRPGEMFASEELRFVLPATKAARTLRDKWDFKYISEKQLLELKANLKAIKEDIRE